MSCVENGQNEAETTNFKKVKMLIFVHIRVRDFCRHGYFLRTSEPSFLSL